MYGNIHLTEVLGLINQSVIDKELKPFSIGFVTYDDNRNTGGRKITINHATILGTLDDHPISLTGKPKNPRHYEHSTRNIRNMDDPTKHPFKVHIRLIYMFNNKYVIW